MTLQISETLSLPLDFVTKTAAVLAQRRKGKTYTASVLAEEFIAAQVPFVALDPTGAWWGLLASADGKEAGLPVVVIGGQRGQLPLDPAGGRFIADLVLDRPGYYVLDLSLLGTKQAERAFAYAFADRLYRRKMHAGMDFPLHLFVDEADMFVPQDRESGDNLMLGAFQSIVRRGGLHGLGTTLISQRPALVNKSVLTQLDVLILLRLVAGNDQDYIDKNYVKRAGTPEQRDALMESLASLALGEAWLWEPGAEPPLFERVQIRRRHTFNSSATPKAGQKRVEPARLAEVDLAAIKEAMAETIQKAKADDPAALRARIRQLERQVAEKPEPVVERVEVPLFDDETLRVIAKMTGSLVGASEAFRRIAGQMDAAMTRQLPPIEKAASTRVEAVQRRSSAPRRPRQSPGESTTPGAADAGKTRQGRAETRPDVPAGNLSKAERAVLTVLLQYGDRSKTQVAVLTGYSHRGGGFNNALGSLRSGGLIEGRENLTITGAGREALGDVQPLPSGSALVEHWSARLGLAERLILDLLVQAWPESLTKQEIATATRYAPNGGGFNNALGKLRGLELLHGRADIVADDAFGVQP